MITGLVTRDRTHHLLEPFDQWSWSFKHPRWMILHQVLYPAAVSIYDVGWYIHQLGAKYNSGALQNFLVTNWLIIVSLSFLVDLMCDFTNLKQVWL